MHTTEKWVTLCSELDLVTNSGVCALLNQQQIALFKVKQGADVQIYAVSNWDPIGKANVLSRGLLGSVANTKVIISPLYKQRYCLSSGQCLDDKAAKLMVYPVRIQDNHVQLLWVD